MSPAAQKELGRAQDRGSMVLSMFSSNGVSFVEHSLFFIRCRHNNSSGCPYTMKSWLPEKLAACSSKAKNGRRRSETAPHVAILRYGGGMTVHHRYMAKKMTAVAFLSNGGITFCG